MADQLGALTKGERLLILRRRTGMSQPEYAAGHFVSRATYGRWERDEGGRQVPDLIVPGLRDHERCLLYRRRSKVTQELVANHLRCCRWTINQMESGQADCDKLLWYWEC